MTLTIRDADSAKTMPHDGGAPADQAKQGLGLALRLRGGAGSNVPSPARGA